MRGRGSGFCRAGRLVSSCSNGSRGELYSTLEMMEKIGSKIKQGERDAREGNRRPFLQEHCAVRKPVRIVVVVREAMFEDQLRLSKILSQSGFATFKVSQIDLSTTLSYCIRSILQK